MEIKQIKIDELKPAEYNPRQLTHDQHQHLTESIKKFGLVDPIIANSHEGRENIIVGGHMRWRVAKELGFEDVPVFYVDLDEEREKELNIRLNKNLGEWNWDTLANNFDNDFLKGIGFTPGELGEVSMGPEREMDKDDLQDSLDSYLGGNIKQIVLYFSKEDFDKIIPRLDAIMQAEAVESHTEAILKTIDFYENFASKKEGA